MNDIRLPARGADDHARRSAASDTSAALLQELRGALRGEVRTARHDRMLYATDASIYQVEPLGVVIPQDVEDLERAVIWCMERGLPVVPRGGGTSLAGQCVNEAVMIDAGAHLRTIRAIDAGERWAEVEPGVVLDQLNRAAQVHGLRFGPDVATSSHATLGGMIGNNSAGANSVLYGRTVEHVHAIDAVLAGGLRVRFEEGAAVRDPRVLDLTRRVAAVVNSVADEIDARWPRVVRRVDGYNLDLMLAQIRASTPETFDRVNLAHLLCGSEGTLGVTLAARVGLVPLPAARGLAIIAFPSIDTALEAVGDILQTQPAAVELVDDLIIRLAARNMEHRDAVTLLPRPVGAEVAAVLFVEYFRPSPDAIESAFRALVDRHGAAWVQGHHDTAAMARAWRLRKAGEPLLHGIPGSRRPVTFIEDTAVDPRHLPEFIRRFRAIVTKHGTVAAYYAHASVGCLHVRPLVDLRNPQDFRVMRAIMDEVTELVVEYGGSLSGEHGDGRLRSHQLERFFGPRLTAALAAIKSIFDPNHRLNPGIIVDPVPMDAALRVRPQDRFIDVPPVRTFHRFEAEHGLLGAVEMCNGAGVCRRTSGGTMCPSYRATLDERHATRGRGNALRLAITGQFTGDPRDRWRDPETLATLDLCLSCKACKRECPSNVDVARMKAEYLAQGFRARGYAPPAAHAFGRIRLLAGAAAMAPGLFNALGRMRLMRALINRVLDMHPQRPLPPFGPSLAGWMRQRPDGPGADAVVRPLVLVYPDCFCAYGESRVGRAAVRLLERFGYRVGLAPAGCCGRSLISTGLLPAALRGIRRTITRLEEATAREAPVAIVGLEPSCVSAIVDDWMDLDLGLPRERVASVAGRVSSIESFLESRWDAHPRRPGITGPPAGSVDRRPVLVHGHCHQKALWGTGDMMSLMTRFLGVDGVRLLDTGCCGMAGSFGYGRERFDLSMRIAELDLFPLLRATDSAAIAAPGTSCRHQIHDGLHRAAQHPVEILLDLIDRPACAESAPA